MDCRISFPQGTILLLVLFYAGLFAVLIQHMTSSVWLNQKMVEDFKKQTIQVKKEERGHAKQQQRVPHHMHIQFVPDSLNFFEVNGTDYYTIITKPEGANQNAFQSYYATRKNDRTSDVLNTKIRLPNQIEAAFTLNLTNKGGSRLILKSNNLQNHEASWYFSEPYLEVVAIDEKNAGVANWLYLVSEQSISRIHLAPLNRPVQELTLGVRKIKADQPLVVGRHPFGIGVLIYVLSLSSQDTWQLIAFSDPFLRVFELKPFFSLDIEPPQTQLRLAADWLFFASSHYLYQIDAYTGRFKKYDLPDTLSGSSNRQLKLMVKSPSSNQAFIEIEGQEQRVAIDLERRLGRSAWHEQTHWT